MILSKSVHHVKPRPEAWAATSVQSENRPSEIGFWRFRRSISRFGQESEDKWTAVTSLQRISFLLISFPFIRPCKFQILYTSLLSSLQGEREQRQRQPAQHEQGN
jgi:hypothetical protein